MSPSVEHPYCVGLHQIYLPEGAGPRFSAAYAGLRGRHQGAAEWDDVLASLRDRAGAAETGRSPRSDRGAELYRTAGADPQAAFSESRLVGFDINDGTAVIAEHSGPSAAFTIEVHRVQDGRHFVFEGESSQASRYPAVRDGVLDAVSRYRPRAPAESPPIDAFCTANGHFRLSGDKDVAGDAQLVATFSDMPGVSFSLNIYGLVEAANEPPFAQRAARDLAELTSLGGQVTRLHSGERSTAGCQVTSLPSAWLRKTPAQATTSISGMHLDARWTPTRRRSKPSCWPKARMASTRTPWMLFGQS